MEIKKKIFAVTIYDEKYELKVPTLKDIKKIGVIEPGKEFDTIVEFLGDMGLPSTVSEEMTVDDVVALFNAVIGKDRKN